MTSFILSSAITTFISTILSIWSVVCMWIIFKKAGRKGWESLIPVWNVYVLFKIAGKKGWFWILLLLPIVWIIVSLISWLTLRSSDINEYSSIYTIRNMCNRILGLLALILPLMAWITLPYGLTKKFGKSNWFYIGMLFLTPIFFGILAFNNDIKYEGVEFNENYSWKKWILITLGISLLIGCSDAGLKYYQYKNYYSYFDNIEYDYDNSYNVDYGYNYDEIDDYGNKLEQINCYTKDGILNNNPERDEYGEIINCYNEKGEEEGKRISYTTNGIKNAEMNFKNGKYNGKVIMFNTDGTVAMEGNYIDDEYIDDSISCYDFYHRLITDPETDENGEIINCYDEYGNHFGKYIEFNRDGSKLFESYWENGEPVGEFIWYNDDGTINTIQHCENGICE